MKPSHADCPPSDPNCKDDCRRISMPRWAFKLLMGATFLGVISTFLTAILTIALLAIIVGQNASISERQEQNAAKVGKMMKQMDTKEE